MLELLLLFAASLVFDVCYTFWSLSVARGNVASASVANFLIPFVSLLPMAYVVDAASWGERLVRCVPVGLAYAIGTAAVMIVAKNKEEKRWKRF